MNVEITQKEIESILFYLKCLRKDTRETYMPVELERLIDSLKFKLSLAKEN